MAKLAEPTWCEPQNLEDCSSLVSSGPTPFFLTGIFKRLLQYHFSDPNNIANPFLKGYIWTDSDNGCLPGSQNADDLSSSSSPDDGSCVTPTAEIPGSNIFIGTNFERTSANVQQRPALLVKRESTRNTETGFRNEALPALNQTTGTYDGKLQQTTIMGSHSIICIGLSGTEAENLGEEVYFRFLHYISVIRDDFRLGKFFVREMQAAKELPEDPHKAFITKVVLEWGYVYRWRVIPETPILKRLSLQFAESD